MKTYYEFKYLTYENGDLKKAVDFANASEWEIVSFQITTVTYLAHVIFRRQNQARVDHAR